MPLYSLVFLCRAVGGTISPHPQECLDAGWFGRDELPEPLASFDRWGEAAFAAIEGNVDEVLYDKSALPEDDLFRRSGDPLLQLVTCGGSYDPATRHYLGNRVVTARPVG